MEESAHPSIPNKSILLSRNHPIAVVVGAAGFLGSALAQKLLSLDVQVVGIDNFSTSRKENLTEAFKDKNFHFLHQSIEDDQIEVGLAGLPHLDYAIFIAENPTSSSLLKNGLHNFLSLSRRYKKGDDGSKTERPKVVLVSSIQVYDNSAQSNLNFLKSAENQFAKFIRNHGLNGRVVRLAEVYGPRMHFREDQAVSRLIKACLEGKLNKEETALDFSSRSLFVDDAVELILKSILSGSTSGKIYDGCLPSPVKIEEIKQILINPDWHLQQNFSHTLLPPWPTSNLERSIKELSWKPKVSPAKGLKETVDFFTQDSEAKAFALNQKKEIEQQKINGWTFGGLEKTGEEKPTRYKHKKNWTGRFAGMLMFLIILGAIFYPLLSFLVGAYSLPASLTRSRQLLTDGDLSGARKALEYAKISLAQMDNLQPIMVALSNSGLIGDTSQQINNLLVAQNEGVAGVDQDLMAIEQSAKVINQGQSDLNSNPFLNSQTHLSAALTILGDSGLKSSWLIPNKSQLLETTNYQYFYDLAQQGRGVSSILPVIFNGQEKNYLLLILDPNYLKPPVGKLSRIGELRLKNGTISLQNLKTITELDSQLAQKNIQLSQNNTSTKAQFSNLTSADFPTFAQTSKVLYQSLSGENIDGVIALNQQVVDRLQQITDMSATTDPTLDQTFGSALNPKNILKTAGIIDQALGQKQMFIYSSDNNLQNSLAGLNWVGTLKASSQDDGLSDFLAFFEDGQIVSGRKYLLQTVIGQEGSVTQTLSVNYNNPQPITLPLELVLPLGSHLTVAKVGESQVPFSSIVDFGRAVYSGQVNIGSGPTSVVFTYTLAKNIEVGEQGENYSLRINKQPGSGNDQFDWQINYPFTWDLVSKIKGVNIAKHQINIETNLDSDKSFDLTFKKQ